MKSVFRRKDLKLIYHEEEDKEDIYEYRCPCGKGRVRIYIDYFCGRAQKPFIDIRCDKCSKKYIGMTPIGRLASEWKLITKNEYKKQYDVTENFTGGTKYTSEEWVEYYRVKEISENGGYYKYDYTSFAEFEKVEPLCKKIICDQAILYCRRTNNVSRGTIEFYISSEKQKSHKRLLRFMIDNGLVKRNDKGELYNIKFHENNPSQEELMGIKVEPKFRLGDFFDLITGELICENCQKNDKKQ